MSRLPQVAKAHRKSYVSDLSDGEWELLADLLPVPKGFGRPRTV
ncbi:MAG: IS5/IS1182 family transposase, partial [Cyanobacteria bacterium P01_E01_bin.34]